jgi:hypothetical protein
MDLPAYIYMIGPFGISRYGFVTFGAFLRENETDDETWFQLPTFWPAILPAPRV